MALPYCSVCRSGYRGTYSVHQTTDSHRRAVRGPVVRRKSARREHAATASRLSRGDPYLTGQVYVRKHRRSPPDDGKAKVVKVEHYVRAAPYRPGGTSWRTRSRRRRRKRA